MIRVQSVPHHANAFQIATIVSETWQYFPSAKAIRRREARHRCFRNMVTELLCALAILIVSQQFTAADRQRFRESCVI